jgi:hypothetical protein
MRTRSPIAWSAIDLATCLIVVIYTLIAPPIKHHHPPAITTLGIYAITASWPKGSNDDVDLYVRDPHGNIVFFSQPSQGQLQLEHDDRGCSSGSGYGLGKHCTNYERVVLRGTVPGEYIVNVHMYAKNDPSATPIVVKLYRLAGNDKIMKQRTVILPHCGQEKTAFRFILDSNGYIVSTNELPFSLVSYGGNCPSNPPPGVDYSYGAGYPNP